MKDHDTSLAQSRHTWLSKTFVEWPEPENVGRPWLPRRYRAGGWRSDGEVFQVFTFISPIEMARFADAVALAQADAFKYLDQYLTWTRKE
jgi:hypothetical protein